jgi:peptidoglycan/LPS O-acetylase OafA/YrhL
MGYPIPKSEKSKLLRLEALRGLAALYVFAGHILIARLGIQHGLLSFIFRFGQEAVMLFFLLSGFVIFYSFSKGKDQTFGGYFRRRWLRIYPIFILALFVSWILSGTKPAETNWLELIGNLFMLQDFSFGKPGVWVDTFYGNSPLWSLSYEWWFYMMFYPLFKFIGAQNRQWVAIAIAGTGLFFGLIYPNQIARFALYFLIWWSGAEMARTYLSGARITISSQKTSLLALLAVASVLVLDVLAWKRNGHPLILGVHPFLEARHFAAAFVLMVCGIFWARWNWRCFDPTIGWFVWLAPISYGLYILHYPIAVNSHWQPASWNPVLQTILAVAGAFAAALFAEMCLQSLAKRIFSPRTI